MSNDQNECKFFPRDERGYYDVPDVQEKHCPTCVYSGKCYIDDVHSWPWTTSECVNAGYAHYRPKSSGYDCSLLELHANECEDELYVKAVTDGTVVDTVEHLSFIRSGRSLLQKAIVDEAMMHMPDHFVLCSEEEFDERIKAWKDKVFQLTEEVERLKAEKEKLSEQVSRLASMQMTIATADQKNLLQFRWFIEYGSWLSNKDVKEIAEIVIGKLVEEDRKRRGEKNGND